MSIFVEQAFLDRDATEARAFYDQWAPTYDADMEALGYLAPSRSAEALRAHVSDFNTPILDFGCGTGLAGQAFRDAGFQHIDGLDLSPEMLSQAEKKGIYRSLHPIRANAAPKGKYEVISAVGMISPGAAPGTTIDILMQALPTGGKLLFSFNEYALADPLQTGRLNEWLDCGAARVLFAEEGPHMTAQQMLSTVYIVEKN